MDDQEARRHIYAPTEGTHAAIRPTGARLGVSGQQWTCDIAPGDVEATFEIDLAAAEKTTLDAWFTSTGDECGAYYVYVERLT